MRTLPLVGLKAKSLRPKNPSRVYRVMGTGINTEIGCHQNNAHNFRVSVFKRVLTVQRGGVDVETTPPSETFYRGRTEPFVKKLSQHSFEVEPVSRSKFLQRYSGLRLARMERALVDLERMERDGTLDVAREAKLRNFVKVEKLLRAKLDKAPRNISPRSPIYNILVGCYIAHLEKILFRLLGDVCGFPVVFKGMNALV